MNLFRVTYKLNVAVDFKSSSVETGKIFTKEGYSAAPGMGTVAVLNSGEYSAGQVWKFYAIISPYSMTSYVTEAIFGIDQAGNVRIVEGAGASLYILESVSGNIGIRATSGTESIEHIYWSVTRVR